MSAFSATIRPIAGATLAVLLCGLAAPAAAATVDYKGKTAQGQGSKVTFSATAKKVKGFKTSASVLCVSAVTSKSLVEAYPVLLQSPTPLKKGKFTIVFTGPSSTTITVKGKLSGNKASGSLDIKYTKTLGYTSGGLLDIGACSANTTWTAKHK